MRSVVAENQFEHFLTSDQHSVLGVLGVIMMMMRMMVMTLMMMMVMRKMRGRRVVCGLGVGRVEA